MIPWCNRPQLQIGLQENCELFASLGAQVVIVNGGGSLEDLAGMLAQAAPPDCVVVDMPGAVFNKCCSLNVGVYSSATEQAFLLDADAIVGRELIEEARRALRPNTFIAVRTAEELVPEAHADILRGLGALTGRRVITELTFTNGRTAAIEFWHGVKGRSLNGLVLMNRSDYIAAEGCNSGLSGWGFEDQDLQIRLQAGLGLERISLSSAIHITHEQEAPELRSANEAKNIATCFANYENGNFLGTYSTDIAEWAPRIGRIVYCAGRWAPAGAQTVPANG
ncbi:MAG: galactosyltransferase-related protein [Bryobacteraceae bacterium]